MPLPVNPFLPRGPESPGPRDPSEPLSLDLAASSRARSNLDVASRWLADNGPGHPSYAEVVAVRDRAAAQLERVAGEAALFPLASFDPARSNRVEDAPERDAGPLWMDAAVLKRSLSSKKLRASQKAEVMGEFMRRNYPDSWEKARKRAGYGAGLAKVVEAVDVPGQVARAGLDTLGRLAVGDPVIPLREQVSDDKGELARSFDKYYVRGNQAAYRALDYLRPSMIQATTEERQDSARAQAEAQAAENIEAAGPAELYAADEAYSTLGGLAGLAAALPGGETSGNALSRWEAARVEATGEMRKDPDLGKRLPGFVGQVALDPLNALAAPFRMFAGLRVTKTGFAVAQSRVEDAARGLSGPAAMAAREAAEEDVLRVVNALHGVAAEVKPGRPRQAKYLLQGREDLDAGIRLMRQSDAATVGRDMIDVGPVLAEGLAEAKRRGERLTQVLIDTTKAEVVGGVRRYPPSAIQYATAKVGRPSDRLVQFGDSLEDDALRAVAERGGAPGRWAARQFRGALSLGRPEKMASPTGASAGDYGGRLFPAESMPHPAMVKRQYVGDRLVDVGPLVEQGELDRALRKIDRKLPDPVHHQIALRIHQEGLLDPVGGSVRELAGRIGAPAAKAISESMEAALAAGRPGYRRGALVGLRLAADEAPLRALAGIYDESIQSPSRLPRRKRSLLFDAVRSSSHPKAASAVAYTRGKRKGNTKAFREVAKHELDAARRASNPLVSDADIRRSEAVHDLSLLDDLRVLSDVDIERALRIAQAPGLHDPAGVGRLLSNYDPETRVAILGVSKFWQGLMSDWYERLKAAGGRLTDHDRERFLTRTLQGDYVPLIQHVESQARIQRQFGLGLIPTAPANLKYRAIAGTLAERNAAAREAFAHTVVEHNMLAGSYGDAAKLYAETHVSKVGHPDYPQWLKDASESALVANYQLFVEDPAQILRTYTSKNARFLAQTRWLRDMERRFPHGRVFAGMEGGGLLARQFDYDRLETSDRLEAMARVRLPRGFMKHEARFQELLARNASIDEAADMFAKAGVDISRSVLSAYRKVHDGEPVYLPAPIVEYLRWSRTPLPELADLGVGVDMFDGLTQAWKGQATVVSIGHITMNLLGNSASVAMQAGLRASVDPNNQIIGGMIAHASDPKVLAKSVTLGGTEMSVGAWQRWFADHIIVDPYNLNQYLEESAGVVGRAAMAPGERAADAALAALSALSAGAAGGPAAAMLAPAVTSVAREAWRAGGLGKWARQEIDGFMENWRRFSSDSAARKAALREIGNRGATGAVGAAIGSQFGLDGTALGAALGSMSAESFVRMMSGFNELVEAQARSTLAVALLRNGESLGEVPLKVSAGLRDYGALTPMERTVMRRAFGFWTWSAGNLQFTPRWMATHAREAAAMNRLVLAMYNHQFDEEDLAMLPPHLRWALLVRVGKHTLAKVKGLPQEDLAEWMRWDGMAPMGVVSRLHPLLIGLVESTVGRSDKHGPKWLFYGRHAGEVTNASRYKDAPQLVKAFIGFKEIPASDRATGQAGSRYVIGNTSAHWLMNKLPGNRLMQLYMQAVTETYEPTYVDTGVSREPSGVERVLATTSPLRLYHMDMDSQEYTERFKARFLRILVEELGKAEPGSVRNFNIHSIDVDAFRPAPR